MGVHKWNSIQPNGTTVSTKPVQYFLTGFLFAVLWASASSMGKIGLQSAEGLVLFVVRFILAGILLLGYSLVIQKDRLPRGSEWGHVTIFGALNTTLYLGIFIVALSEVTAGITSIALALNPLMISVITAFWTKRPIARIEWVSLLLGMAGVSVASYPLLVHSYATPVGLLMLASCMVAYSVGAVYYATIPWKLSRTAVNGWQVLIGGILLIPVAFLLHTKANQFDDRFWFSVLWLVIPVSIGAVQLWLYLLKIDAVKASLWLYVCPVFGLALASVLLDEPFTGYTFVGTAIVFAALLLGQQKRYA
ncbi:MAG: EamA family transporter [Bacteroidetes bacterium]|nr:EamA family transporter [Bacteroidota bacterium]